MRFKNYASGFDFQRKAWFDRLGGVGYSRAPPMLAAAPGKTGWRAQVFAWRVALADRLRVALPGQRGAFAAAILVGDRSTIDPARLEDLRRSNLAHLLASQPSLLSAISAQSQRAFSISLYFNCS